MYKSIIAAAVLLAASIQPAAAVTLTVNSAADTADVTPGDGVCGVPTPPPPAPPPGNSCTLRAAIQEANANAAAGNVIDLTGQATNTITVLTALPDVTKGVTFNGPTDRVTVDGADNASLFRFTCSSTCPNGSLYQMQNVIIKNGKTTDALGGGGIYFGPLGSVTFNVTNVDVISSAATAGPGGGIAINLLANNSSVDLKQVHVGTTANGNTATGNGGGLWVRFAGSTGTMTLENSTVVANSSSAGSGGGINVKRGRLNVFESTISGNTANGAGGGIFLETETSSGGNVRLENDTIAANDATTGGGVAAAANNPMASAMIFTTLTANTAHTTGTGGGIQPQATALTTFPGNGLNPFTSNIIANNKANSLLNNCSATIAHNDAVNSGYNLADDTTCGSADGVNHDHVVTTANLKLAALANNPAVVAPQIAPQTFALQAGSLAIDAGNPNWDTGSDERAAASQDGGADGIPGDSAPVRDIGAYEFGGFGLIQFDFPGASNDFPVGEDNSPALVLIKRYGTASALTSAPTVVFNSSDSAPVSATQGACSTSGNDYTALASDLNVVFATTVISQTETITICPDAAVEGPETFNIALTKPASDTAGYDLGPRSTGTVTINDVENGVFAFDNSVTPHTAVEGNVGTNGHIDLTITRTSGKDGAMRVNYQTVGKGTGINCPTAACSATADADFTSVTSFVDFADQETSKVITIDFIGDGAFEPNETFRVNLTSVSCQNLPSGHTCDPGSHLVGTATDPSRFAVVSITNDDTAVPGAIQYSSATYTGTKGTGGTMTVTVNRVGGGDGSVSVTYGATDGTAKAAPTASDPDPDYALAPPPDDHVLTWGIGETGAKTFDVSLFPDSSPESNKTFTLTLGSLTSNCPDPAAPTNCTTLPGGTSTATATLASNMPPQIKFSPSATYTTQEGSMASLSVTSGAFDGPSITVPYYTVDGTAISSTANADYTGVPQGTPGTLTFDGSGTAQPISIMTTGDSQAEGNETFSVQLDTPTGGGVIAGTNPATVTIVDPPAARFAAATFSRANEINSGTITVTVDRIGDPSAPFTVDFAISQNCASPPTAGCAEESVDYTRAQGFGGTLSWAATDTASKTFSISVLGDTLIEGDESIKLDLSNPRTGVAPGVPAALGTPSTALAIIPDDDYRFEIVDVSPLAVSEGAGNAVVTVRRFGSTIGAATVDFATADDTAVAGTDYTATASPPKLTWAAGDGADKTISVPLTDNSVDQVDRSFTVGLSGPSNNAVGEATSVAGSPLTVQITDDDAPPTVSFSAASQPVTEGTGAGTTSVTVTATLAAISTFDVTVPFTVGGTSTAADHNAAAGSISIPAGATTGTYNFTVTRDALYEADETVVFTMGTPTNATAAAPTTHTVTITDDDAAPTVSFSTATQNVTEGNGSGTTPVTITASLSAVSGKAVTVPFTVGGTATSTDHNAVSGTISIPAGSSSGTYNFGVLRDSTNEVAETVVFTMGTPTNATPAAPTTETVTITDDDLPPSSGGGGSFDLLSLLLLVPAWVRRRRSVSRI